MKQPRTGKSRRPGHGASLATLLLTAFAVLLFLPTPTLASTSVTVLAGPNTGIVQAGTSPSIPVTSTGTTLVALTKALAASPSAGTQSIGALGSAGTTSTVSPCRKGPCTSNYGPAAPAALTAGDWAMELTLSATQPPRKLAVPYGFAVELAVDTSVGWFFLHAYLSSGTTPARTGQALVLHLLLDLGTRVRPLVLAVGVTINACATAGACP